MKAVVEPALAGVGGEEQLLAPRTVVSAGQIAAPLDSDSTRPKPEPQRPSCLRKPRVSFSEQLAVKHEARPAIATPSRTPVPSSARAAAAGAVRVSTEAKLASQRAVLCEANNIVPQSYNERQALQAEFKRLGLTLGRAGASVGSWRMAAACLRSSTRSGRRRWQTTRRPRYTHD